MTTFTDKFNVTWHLELTLEGAYRIEAYDFAGKVKPIRLVPPQDDLFSTQIGDTRVIFGMAWMLLQDAIQAFNQNTPTRIDNELDFAKRFDGPAITRLKLAMWEELTSFFPEAATTLKALTGRFSKVVQVANDKLAGKINQVLSDSEIERMVDEQIAKIPTWESSSTNTIP